MVNQKITKALFLPVSIVLLFACRKAPIANTALPGKVYSFYNLPYIKTDGRFLFQNNDITNDSAIKRNTLISGIFFNTTNMVYDIGGMVNIAGYVMQPNSNGQYQLYNLGTDSLFGKTISYNIQLPANAGNGVISGSLYSPAPIFATNLGQNATVNIQSNSAFSITWPTDAKNFNGVNVTAKYYPNYQSNGLLAQGDSLYIENTVMVPDNGSTSLPASFFSKFPTGATLWIFIGRGNAVYVQSGQYIYLINGFFTSAFFAVKK